MIFDLAEKLRAAGIFQWHEVEQFCQAFFVKNKSNAAIANNCKPAVERWQKRYQSALQAYQQAQDIVERAKNANDPVLIANAEQSFKDCKTEKDALELFKKDLGTFFRFYEFMSQIVDYDDKDLEKLALYARSLQPMLREVATEEESIDLDSVTLTHYRLARLRQQDLELQGEDAAEYQLQPGEGAGSGIAKDKQDEFLSQIIDRLNEVFLTDELTEKDLVNYAYTIRDKICENEQVMTQIMNNTAEQAFLGDFRPALDDAVIDCGEAHHNQMEQLLSDSAKADKFANVVFDLIKAAAIL